MVIVNEATECESEESSTSHITTMRVLKFDGEPGEFLSIVDAARNRLLELKENSPTNRHKVNEAYVTLFALMNQWSKARGIGVTAIVEGIKL